MDGSIKKAGGVFASLLNRRDGGSAAEPPAHREPEIPEGWPRKLPFRKRPKPYSRSVPWAPTPESPSLQINPTVRDRSRPYELFVAQSVLHEVRQHLITASTDEPFGFLLGQVVYCPWTETPYVLVDAVRRETQNLPPSDEVDRFRHAWIGATRDARHRREQLIGWYHRHGVLGMRMSEWDLKLQDEFFPEPWQVALIIAASSQGPIGGFIQRSHRARLFRKGLAPFYELVDLDAKRVDGMKASVVDWSNYQSEHPVHIIEAKWPSPTKNALRWSEASHATEGVVPLKEPEDSSEVLEFPAPKADAPPDSAPVATQPFDPELAEAVQTPSAPGGNAPSPEEAEVDKTSSEEWMAMLAAEAHASRHAAKQEAREAEEEEAARAKKEEAAAAAAEREAVRAAEQAAIKAAEERAAKAVEEAAARAAEQAAARAAESAAMKAEHEAAIRAVEAAGVKAAEAAAAKAVAEVTARLAEEAAVREAEEAAVKEAERREAEELAATRAAAAKAEEEAAAQQAEEEAAAEVARAAQEERLARSAEKKAKRAASKRAARQAKKAAAAAIAKKEADARAEREALAAAEKAETERSATEAEETTAPEAAETAPREAAAQEAAVEEPRPQETVPTEPPIEPIREPAGPTRQRYEDGIPVVLVQGERWRPTKNVVRAAATVVVLLGAGFGVRALLTGSTSVEASPTLTARPPTVFQQPPEEFTRLEGAFRSALQDYRARYVAFQQGRGSCEVLATDFDLVVRNHALLAAYTATRPQTSAPFSTLDASYRAAVTRFGSTGCAVLPPSTEVPAGVATDTIAVPLDGLARPPALDTSAVSPSEEGRH